MNILCMYEEKIRVHFWFIWVFRKYIFCVQLHGKWARWGHYNLYFEALKGLLLKNTPKFFFLTFAENVTLLSLNIIKLIPLGASTLKHPETNCLKNSKMVLEL